MAEGLKIHVCIVDGQHVDVVKTGVPLSICLLLQQQGLQWTALNGQPSRQLPDFQCRKIKAAGQLALGRSENQEQLPSPAPLSFEIRTHTTASGCMFTCSLTCLHARQFASGQEAFVYDDHQPMHISEPKINFSSCACTQYSLESYVKDKQPISEVISLLSLLSFHWII